MVYLTGDCHGDWNRFSTVRFPAQKEMTEKDIVIVLGDFGIWDDSAEERYWLNVLSNRNFTTVFLDGNHENFDRLNGNEFETVDFHGGKAHKIREHIYHLMRGYVYQLEGKKFFVFGGAKSHDISDGIIRARDYKSYADQWKDYQTKLRRGKMVRMEHESWWEEELPSEEELHRGLDSLLQCGNHVDYILSHCASTHIAAMLGFHESDRLCDYFEDLEGLVDFREWYFGHYHTERRIDEKHSVLYQSIVRIL